MRTSSPALSPIHVSESFLEGRIMEELDISINSEDETDEEIEEIAVEESPIKKRKSPPSKKTPERKKPKSHAKSPRKESKIKKKSLKKTTSTLEQTIIESEPTKNYGNWEQLSLFWPESERPEGPLRDREWVNQQQFADLLNIHTKIEAKEKKETSNGASAFRADKKPSTKLFSEEEDDYFEKLHPARFLRMPLSSPEVYWKDIPYRREEIYKNINLTHTGAEGQVSDRTITLVHDRRNPLLLKYFHRLNASVTSKPLRAESKRDGNSMAFVTDFCWAEIDSAKHVIDAIINFNIINSTIWPYDQTGQLLLKLYNRYGNFPYGNTEKERINLFSTHFARVSEVNCSRACRNECPLPYEGLEKILKEVLGDHDLPLEPPHAGFRIPKFQLPGNSRQNQPIIKNQAYQSSTSRSKPPLPTTKDGAWVCYAFNKKNCTRKPTPKGCSDGTKEYRHVCTFYYFKETRYCLQNHAQMDHK